MALSATSDWFGNLGETKNITIYKARSTYTHTLRYDFGKYKNALITTKTANTSVQFKAIESYALEFKESDSGIGTIYCDTFDGNKFLGTTQAKFWVWFSEGPSCSGITVTRVEATVPPAWGIYVQDCSSVKVTFNNVKMSYESPIDYYSVCMNEENYEGAHGQPVISKTNTVTLPCNIDQDVGYDCWVFDKRGNAWRSQFSINVTPYEKPSISNVVTERCDSNGTLNSDGRYIKCNAAFSFASCAGKNSLKSNWVRYRADGGTWSATTNYKDNVVIGANNISQDSSYEVQYGITDQLGNACYFSDVISPSFSTIEIKKGGKAISFGKICEIDNTFECDFDTKLNKNLDVGRNILLNGINIIENGLNYIKYANGVLICYNRVAFGGTITTATGSLYRSSLYELGEYPVAFINNPVVTLQSVSASNLTWIATSVIGSNTTAPSIYFLSTATSSNSTLRCNYTAIGMWK